jgi:hypothetical protein
LQLRAFFGAMATMPLLMASQNAGALHVNAACAGIFARLQHQWTNADVLGHSRLR